MGTFYLLCIYHNSLVNVIYISIIFSMIYQCIRPVILNNLNAASVCVSYYIYTRLINGVERGTLSGINICS